MEDIPNLLDKPSEVIYIFKKANFKDIDILIIRRKEECKEFHEKYNSKTSSNKQYLLDIEWFLQWKCFVTNDLTDKHLSNQEKLVSANSQIGVLFPGPIVNHKLLDSSKNLRKSIKNVK